MRWTFVAVVALFCFLARPALPLDECGPNYVALLPSYAKDQLRSGQEVRIHFEDGTDSTLLFAGRTVSSDGKNVSALFYDGQKDILRILPWDQVQWKAEGAPVIPETRALAQPMSAHPSLVSANTLFLAFLQVKHDGKLGSSHWSGLTSERNRMSFFAELFNELHYVNRAKTNATVDEVLPSLAARFQVPLRRLPSAADRLVEQLDRELADGSPVVLTYLPRTHQSPVANFPAGQSPIREDNIVPQKTQKRRSWLDKLLGWKPAKRHQAVLLSAFDGPGGSRRYLVLEGSADLPRMWDAADVAEVQGNGLMAYSLRGKAGGAK